MIKRSWSSWSLFVVAGLSAVAGGLLGARLASADVSGESVTAAEPVALRLLPAMNPVTPTVDFADTVDRAMPAVVSVTSTKLETERRPQGRREMTDPFHFFFGDPNDEGPSPHGEPSVGEGSGFFISPEGYLLTNNHVVEDADRIKVRMQDGREFTARVVGTDPSIDLALLKVDAGQDELPSLPLGDSEQLRVGQWVIAIGNPLEYEHTVTVGVVSGKDRRVAIGSTDQGVVNFIQTDAAINFGNSGGPLLDAAGNVVGINTAIRRANYAEGIGFALPINQARRAVEQLQAKGHVSRGYIGITMNPRGVDAQVRDFYGLPDTRGVIVQGVQDGGPAERAGVHREDIIRKVDGATVKDNLDLISKISAHQPGEQVEMELFRAGKTVTVRATLTDRQQGIEARNQPAGSQPRPEGAPAQATGLGITVNNLTGNQRERMSLDPGEQGVIVTDVDFDSPASSEGIAANMIIVSVSGHPTRNVEEWEDALGELRPGSVAKLEVLTAPGNGAFFYLRVPAAGE